MNNDIHNIKRLFCVIDQSLFTISGKLDYNRITDAIIALCNAIEHYCDPNNFDHDSESIWYIGEGGNCCLSDLIIGAFWHYTEWHSEQWSKGYQALSVLGDIFSPGMSYPESDNEAYRALNSLAEESV